MRLFGAVLICLLLLTTPAWSQTRQEEAKKIFQTAVEAYKKGDYNESVRLNSSVLSMGLESPAVYYNLGNSYLRSRQMGLALASYLRAERLAPRDSDIQANLNYVRGLVNQPQWQSHVLLEPLDHFTIMEIRWAVLILFMLISSLFLWGLFVGLKGRRILFIVMVGACVWVYLAVGLVARQSGQSGRGVALEATEARFEPSVGATTYFKLPEGSEVKIQREQTGWLKIERPDRRVGWVPASAMERI